MVPLDGVSVVQVLAGFLGFLMDMKPCRRFWANCMPESEEHEGAECRRDTDHPIHCMSVREGKGLPSVTLIVLWQPE